MDFSAKIRVAESYSCLLVVLLFDKSANTGPRL